MKKFPNNFVDKILKRCLENDYEKRTSITDLEH